MSRLPRILLASLLLVPFLFGASGEPRIRIGVFGLLTPTELTIRPVEGSVIVLAAGKESLTLEGSQLATILLAEDEMEVRLPAQSEPFVVRSVRATGREGAPGGFVLSVPGRLERTFQGTLAVTAEDGQLVPVIEMDLTTAVASVLDAELSGEVPLEALKAQAVVARSFYVAQRHRHELFDFCDTTHCQFLREPPPPGSQARRAAEATRSLVLSYQGKVVPALYSASCGGRTFTLDEVGLHSIHYPFFAVPCPICRAGAERWRRSLRNAEAEAVLTNARSESVRIAVGRLMGWKAIPSNNYTVESDENGIVLHGSGSGHGVGLCQTGAKGFARAGADFRSILRHYFPNTVLSAH